MQFHMFSDRACALRASALWRAHRGCAGAFPLQMPRLQMTRIFDQPFPSYLQSRLIRLTTQPRLVCTLGLLWPDCWMLYRLVGSEPCVTDDRTVCVRVILGDTHGRHGIWNGQLLFAGTNFARTSHFVLRVHDRLPCMPI